MNIKDIKKGQRFSESEFGMTVIMEATTDAIRVENREGFADGWEVMGRCVGGDGTIGEEDRFFAADCAPQYGPDLHHVCDKEVKP